MPRAIVRYFGPGPEQVWYRLVRVLGYTLSVHCPEWVQDFRSVAPPDFYSPLGVQSHVTNTHKLDHWLDAVKAAPDGTELALLDGDLAVFRPLDDLWSRSFDLAYTVKPKHSIFPLNGGVVFVRTSEPVRQFVQRWRDLNRFFLDNPREFDVWRFEYGGVNQTALGVLLREPHPDLDITKLPCLEWNCEDDHWSQFDPVVTRVLHCKGELRRALFHHAKPDDEWRPAFNHWRSLEKEAMRWEARASA